MALVFKKCPHCRYLLPDTNAGIYIESPFRDCEKCGNLFIDSERNEWECSSLFLKLGFFFRYSISSFAYSMLTVALVYGLQKYLSFQMLSENALLTLFVILVGVGLFYFGGRLQADVAASKQRTQSPEYRLALKKAGFKLR